MNMSIIGFENRPFRFTKTIRLFSLYLWQAVLKVQEVRQHA